MTVQKENGPIPDCPWCEGSGVRIGHSDGCADPLCTPGVDCNGQEKPCLCDPHKMFHLAPPVRCWYCGVATRSLDWNGPTPTTDHQIPRSRGGGDEPGNLVVACFQCNAAKGARTVSEYRAALEHQAGTPCVFYGEREEVDDA